MKRHQHESQNKKEMMIRKILKRKAVMIIQEEHGKNLDTFHSQLEFALSTEQLGQNFERLMVQERVENPCALYPSYQDLIKEKLEARYQRRTTKIFTSPDVEDSDDDTHLARRNTRFLSTIKESDNYEQKKLL